MDITLVKPTYDYQNLIEIAQNDYDGYISGASSLHEYLNDVNNWINFTQEMEDSSRIAASYVPSIQYLALNTKENKIIGFVNIRLSLNDYLFNFGGHIGYSVLPSEKRQGYASEILRLVLKEAKRLNINPVLMTCNEDNIASSKVIEKNGGVFEDIRIDPTDGVPVKRF